MAKLSHCAETQNCNTLADWLLGNTVGHLQCKLVTFISTKLVCGANMITLSVIGPGKTGTSCNRYRPIREQAIR